MNQQQALEANQNKSKLIKETRQNLGEKEFNQRYVGDYKGHIHKVKGMFHNIKTGKRNYDQVDKTLQFLMNKPK